MIYVRDLHQLELSSHCNLRCKYCPSRALPRPKLYMSREHFVRALGWIKLFNDRGTQQEVNLAGIGESTMHPEFASMINQARELLGWNIQLVFATNGLLITDELVKEIRDAQPRVFVSLHRPERAGPAIEILKKHGLFAGASADPSMAATNWAGQVKWHVSVLEKRQCPWVRNGKAFMLADGRISRCAYDATGDGVIGHINDELDKLVTSRWSLCAGCDQEVGV